MEVCLAQARWDCVRERPAEDAERLFVANNLAVTLQESAGDYAGALVLLEEVLAVRRRTLGDEHPDTLDSITNLALHHTETGNFEAALTLSEEVVASHRKCMAASQEVIDEEAAHSIGSLAVVHNLMGNCALAYTLHLEALEIRQRLLGDTHLDTLNSRYGLGQCLVGLGRHEEALAMLDRVASTSLRVFGEKHPTYQHFSNGLAEVRERVAQEEAAGDTTAAAGATMVAGGTNTAAGATITDATVTETAVPTGTPTTRMPVTVPTPSPSPSPTPAPTLTLTPGPAPPAPTRGPS
jgi:tetratricopeptide (TPR) repeat protein